MARLVVTELADRDLATIVVYLANEAGAATAGKYFERFDALYERLTDFPGLGAPRPLLGDEVRISTVPPYVVIYEHHPSENIVMILRIIHGRRNITRDLLTG